MRPKLIHPVKITVLQIDRARTPPRDQQFSEPTGAPIYLPDPIIISAQLGLGATERYRQRPHGDDPQSDGHIAVMADRLAREAPGVDLHVGDKVLCIAVGMPEERTVEWNLIEVRPAFHYRSKPYGWLCYYQDLKTLFQTT